MKSFYPLADASLSRRLELAEGNTNRDLVETRRSVDPASGAESLEVGGTLAMFDGPDSPLTQTFALGMTSEPAAGDLSALEKFFEERGADTCHEVSPVASPTILALLTERRYEPVEFTSILYRPIDGESGDLAASRRGAVTVRIVSHAEADLWGRIAAEGWTELGDLSGFFERIARMTIESRLMKAFLADENGRAVATGALSIHEGVALLAGASTVPDARRRGAQSALLQARLRFAAEAGCDLAMIGAAPGSASQRNAERQQFRIAYTRVKWRKQGHRAADLSKVN